eukprot:3098581-Pyramimonas_sp.AAC.1
MAPTTTATWTSAATYRSGATGREIGSGELPMGEGHACWVGVQGRLPSPGAAVSVSGMSMGPMGATLPSGTHHDNDGVEKREDSDVLMAEESGAGSAGAEEAPPPPEPHLAERVRRRITGKRALQDAQEQGPALAHVRAAAAAPMKRPAKK